MKRIFTALGLFAALLSGCKKSQSQPPPAQPAALPAPPVTIANVHWLGIKALAGKTNTAGLMRIGNLPQTAQLESQTLDKLSVAPWRLLLGQVTNAEAASLHPLLEDLVQDESYLEIRTASAQPGRLAANPASGELVLAIRLDESRAQAWQTNLGRVMQSLTHIQPKPAGPGWRLKKHEPPNLVEFTRAGAWTLVGLAQDTNSLLEEVRGRLDRGGAPLANPATDAWMDAEIDLRRVAAAFPRLCSPGLADRLGGFPAISVRISGSAGRIETRGRLDFPQPLQLEWEPWNIPTNLIGQAVASLAAVRAVVPSLASTLGWSRLQAGPPPNQAFAWSLPGNMATLNVAVPLADASNAVSRVTDLVLQKVNPWFETNLPGSSRVGLARFDRATTYNGLEWKGLPFMMPFLKSQDGFAVAGMFPLVARGPLPAPLVNQILARTNLVAYQWELTNMRLQHWLELGQFLRLVCGRAQLPPQSASLEWFKAAAPDLRDCTTEVTATGPNQLSFVRRSSVGFSALELHVLADWLESPEFPLGLYSLETKIPPVRRPAPHRPQAHPQPRP